MKHRTTKKACRWVNWQTFFVLSKKKNRIKTTASPVAQGQVCKVVVMMFYNEIHIILLIFV
jgi:hypothetical protein